MTVSSAVAISQARRRRPRRRQDKAAIVSRLVLDDHVKSDAGIISEDLFAELFPHLQAEEEQAEAVPDVLHVAIAPWAPSHSADGTTWTIVPVTKSAALAHSTVQFSPSSLALQSFATRLQRVAPSKLSSHSRSGIEILVLDVSVMPLANVFVSLEGDLAKRLENGEGTFFREHPVNGHDRGVTGRSSSAEDRLTAALRVALSTLRVVHDGDLFPLPLPPHPVTHMPPSAGKVDLCEPVAQGILTASTRIILTKARVRATRRREAASIPTSRRLHDVVEDDVDNDTANDQYYSAVEERCRTDVTIEDADSTTETESDEAGGEEQDDELSDDSMDDMISLQTPTLPRTAASGVSTLQPGTPVGRGRTTNGISTPMSVYSSYTSTTARLHGPRGRLYRAQGLAHAIPPELLHPKPAPEEDEEARIFVDVRELPRIGCLSGDWVRLEVSEEPPANGLGAFGLGNFDGAGESEASWRPAKIFSLPEGYYQRAVTRIAKCRNEGRRLSFFESQMERPRGPTAHLSPILLANMESTSYLRLSPLTRGTRAGKHGSARLTNTSQPPSAREVVLQQVRSPVPVEREVQTAVMAGLKWYFAKKLRMVKSGDLVAVPIDSQLGRTLQETSSSVGDESAVDQVLSLMKSSRTGQHVKYDEVAWFKVGHVQTMRPEADEDGRDEEDTWGSVACVDSSTAHLEQTGSVTSRVPGTKDSSWRYYLGLKKPPRAECLSLDPDGQYVSPVRRRLRELLAAAASKRATQLNMPAVAILLISTHRNIGKATAARDACLDIGLHTFTMDGYDILNEGGARGSDVKAEALLLSRAERAMSCGPECCALLMRHVEGLAAGGMVSFMKDILATARVLIATTTEADKLPDGLRGLFTHELEVNAPDETEREGILRTVVQDNGLGLHADVDLGAVALKTAALVAGDLVDVVDRAVVAQQARLERLALFCGNKVTVRDVQVAGGAAARGLTRADFLVAVEAARKSFADAIGAPKIPNVTWDDVGGLSNVKEAVRETIQLPLERPELFARGMRKRSGLLFYGPPGTGKTLLAKAIATEYSLNFFSVKGPELLNMYIGESEANVRRVFARARDARPCVVFFDELDSVAPKRGNQGDSGGVMDRIVSQLLAELDGMSSSSPEDKRSGGVFVIGATNRPDLLDPALLRPGRFDKMLYLGVPDTHEKQLTVMEALTRKFSLDPSVSLRAVAEKLPFTYTGADFYALCSDAMLKAVTRQAANVDAKLRALNSTRTPAAAAVSTAYFFDHFATPDDVAVSVTERDFLDAHRELVPSVSAGELMHYERVRATFEGRGGGGSRPPALAVASSKGKGKAVAVSSSASSRRDVVAVGSDGDVDAHYGGSGKGKGKGKAVASGFRNGGASDDDGLYE